MEQLQQFEDWEAEEDLTERWRTVEQDLDNLIKSHHKLKLTNRNLKAEWESMVQRNMELRRRIEAVIGRVRALERGADDAASNVAQGAE